MPANLLHQVLSRIGTLTLLLAGAAFAAGFQFGYKFAGQAIGSDANGKLFTGPNYWKPVPRVEALLQAR